MEFKKHNWIRYGRKGNIVYIEIQEADGAKIDNFKVNNQRDYARIIKMIKDKYNYSPEISPEESVNNELKEAQDWISADKDFKWGETK